MPFEYIFMPESLTNTEQSVKKKKKKENLLTINSNEYNLTICSNTNLLY